MSIIRALKSGEKRQMPNNHTGFQSWLTEMIRGQKTNSGVEVKQSTAMQLTAVYASVRILSETVAHLPFPVYKRLERGKERDHRHPLYEVLQNQANPHMTAFSFRETMMQHLLLWGNAFAEIQHNGRGEVVALWPLLPDKVEIIERQDRKGLEYGYHKPDGTPVILPSNKVLHIPGMGYDGFQGYAPLKMAKESIGMGLATEQYGATFFKNGGQPSGVLEHPNALNDEGSRRMREDWERLHNGLTNAHRVAILEQGTKYAQIGIPPEQAQFLETRKFQTNEIARFFRVPPHMLGDLERSTFSNIEQQSIDFVTHSITPWLKRWEQSVRMQLLSKESKKTHMAEFVLEGLMRGDTNNRYQAYAQARQNGWMSANDIRELENMNPVEGGDVYLIPVNMTPADKVYDQIEQQQQNQPNQQNPFDPNDDNEPPDDDDLLDGSDDDDDNPGSEDRSLNLSDYQQRALSFRSNLRDSNERLLKQYVKRFFEKEESDVMAKAEKSFESRDSQSSFINWLSDYYDTEREDIDAQMRPLMDSIGDQVYASVQSELDTQVPMSGDVRSFIQNYVRQMAKRISGNSFSQLVQTIEDNPEDITSSLRNTFSNFQTDRADSIARDESVRSSGAITVAAYTALGVVTMRWVSEPEPCPYCAQMSGTVVEVGSGFLDDGDALEVDGEDTFRPGGKVGHAPLHGGCRCQVISET